MGNNECGPGQRLVVLCVQNRPCSLEQSCLTFREEEGETYR